MLYIVSMLLNYGSYIVYLLQTKLIINFIEILCMAD